MTAATKPNQTGVAPTTIPASPGWGRTLPNGPDSRVKITPAYAKHVASDAYFWAWPMVNIYNRRLYFTEIEEPRMAGPLPQGPLNTLTMMTDYVDPAERGIACPNQDVVYGVGSLALDLTPVVVQVPDFGPDRFWVYQAVDLRTDGFIKLGRMYGSTPGFYLLVGPDWSGDVPAGITGVFRSPSNTGFIAPRIFLDDTAEDRAAIQDVLTRVVAYPVSEFDGTFKTIDWPNITHLPSPPQGDTEAQWVFPEKFAAELPIVLADAPPLPGEEARYAQVLAVLAAAKNDPTLAQAVLEGAQEAEANLVTPLFQFRNYGQQLPDHWSTISNEAAFGVDYFTRTAAAKSNILVNAPVETKYFYQDLDVDGQRLNSGSSYTVTFPAGQTPPVHGFWSLSIYNAHHFFIDNPIKRYSVGTKNKTLELGDDGSLTIYVQTEEPTDPVQRANWLPVPEGDFSLYVRAYWPATEVLEGSWTPPAVLKSA